MTVYTLCEQKKQRIGFVHKPNHQKPSDQKHVAVISPSPALPGTFSSGVFEALYFIHCSRATDGLEGRQPKQVGHVTAEPEVLISLLQTQTRQRLSASAPVCP